MLKNSYIFLSREKKKKKIQKTEKNVIVIDFLPSFSELLKNSFDNIIFEPKEKSICFIGAVVLKIDYNNKCVNVYFKYYNVWSNYYLDIIVKENKMIDNINVLDIIKEKSNRVKDNNISKKDYYIKSSFYSLDYNDIETLLFTKSVTEEERLEVESFLIENKDLTKIEDKKTRKIIDINRPKNDWERFFDNKKIDKDFQTIFANIRYFRNNIAHCKFVSKLQYKEWLKVIKDTTKSIDVAIKITEEKDFIIKNIEMQSKSFNRFAKSIGEIVMNNYKPLMKNISAITQPIIAMTERMSKLVKPITAIISDLIPRIEIPEIEFSKFDIPNIPVILMKKKVLVRT